MVNSEERPLQNAHILDRLGMLKLALLTALLFIASLATSSFARAGERPLGFRPGEVTTRRVATALALTCEPASWAALARSGKLTNFENKQTIRLKLRGTVAELDHPQMKVERTSGGTWRATYANHTIEGQDACELMMKMPTRQASLLSIFESKALAKDLVTEDNTEDYVNLAFTAGTLAVTAAFFPPAGLISGAFFLWDCYSMGQSSLSLATKRSYQDILNSEFELQCSDSAVVLKSNAGRIVVKKTFTKLGRIVTIDLFGKDSDTPFEGASTYAPKSAEFLRKMAADCDSKEDADRWAIHLKVERADALAKVDKATPITLPAQPSAPNAPSQVTH